MAWVRVESSVPRHRKFLQAGPAPSWLWLCGLAYCQEGLTDGFIPCEALPHLGVGKNASHLVDRLVKSRLWEIVDGGWRIHDYLEHNRSAEKVRGIKADRREAGARGGEASGEARREARLKQSAAATAKQTANPSTSTATSTETSTSTATAKARTGPRDQWFLELWTEYPSARRQRGPVVEQLFNAQFNEDERVDEAIWSDMWQGLQSQKAGYEWRVKNVVPAMSKWLSEGQWRNRHEAAPVSAQVSDKTARTLSSLAEFVKDGTR